MNNNNFRRRLMLQCNSTIDLTKYFDIDKYNPIYEDDSYKSSNYKEGDEVTVTVETYLKSDNPLFYLARSIGKADNYFDGGKLVVNYRLLDYIGNSRYQSIVVPITDSQGILKITLLKEEVPYTLTGGSWRSYVGSLCKLQSVKFIKQ